MNSLQEMLEKNNIKVENEIQIWKPIVGFKKVIDNLYEVSNDGEVRNMMTKELRHKKLATKLYHSYYAVSLKCNTGKLEWVLMHQLVAHAFLPLPDELKQYVGTNMLVVDHIDNNGLNNHVTNLQWASRSENIRLTATRGDAQHNGIRQKNFTFEDLNNMCNGLTTTKSYKDILIENNLDYNVGNVRLLRGISRKNVALNMKDILDSYNIKGYEYGGDNINNLDFGSLHKICQMLANEESYKKILRECGFPYTYANVKFLQDLEAHKINFKAIDLVERYDIPTIERVTNNAYRATHQQNPIAEKLPLIRDLIKSGKTNSEIVDMIWTDLPKSTRKSRVRTVHHIRTGQIYKTDND